MGALIVLAYPSLSASDAAWRIEDLRRQHDGLHVVRREADRVTPVAAVPLGDPR